jgi:thioredoxin 1
MLIVKRFTASWCQPCKQLAPVFATLQNEIPEASFQTIDVDVNKDAAVQAGVTSIPTVIIEKDGQQVYRFNGVLPKPTIVGIIKKYL